LYEIECVDKPSWQHKKHAADLSPYPPELIPFKLIDSADNRYSQLYWLIGKSLYKEANIEGLTTPQPFYIASHFFTIGDFHDFHFPSLVEINEEICPLLWINNKEQTRMMSCDDFEEAPILYLGPPPSLVAPIPPSTPILSTLVVT
jgi:hypothetical protein